MKKWLLLGLFVLLLAPSFAILNTKNYDSITNTITIKDWLGLSDYETIKFTSEKYGLTDMEVIQQITPAQSMTAKEAFGKIEFINKAGKDWADKKITYQVQYEVTETYKEKEDVWGTCEKDIKADEKNGTKEQKGVKYDCITYTKEVEKQKTTLKNFWDLDKLTAKQTYIVHITAHKSPTTPASDWIATYGGLAIKEKAWWNTDWTYCRDIPITTGIAWTDGVAVVNITGISGTITGLEIVNKACKDDGTAINRTILHYGASSAYVTFLVDGTNPTYSVYYAPIGVYTSSPNATYFYDEFEDGAYADKWAVAYGDLAELNGYLRIGQANSKINSLITDMPYALMWFDMAQDSDGATTFGFYNPTGNTLRHIGESRNTKSNNPSASVAWAGYSNLRHNYTIRWTETKVNGTEIDTPNGATATTSALATAGLTIEYGYPNGNDYQYVYDMKIYPSYANLYGQGATTYSIGAEESNAVVGITTLNSPANNFNTSSNSVTFNCTATALTGYDIQNITLYVYKADSTTSTSLSSYAGTNNNETKVTSATITEGSNKWNCKACDDLNCTWATANRTLRLDTQPPIVNVISPLDNTQVMVWNLPYNLTLNATQSDSGTGLSTCKWRNYTATTACYQETANAITIGDGSCGLDYSGYYSSDYFWNLSAQNNTNAHDGDWGTFAYGIAGQLQIHYKKPATASGATWIVKRGSPLNTTYDTIPNDCYNFYANEVYVMVDIGSTASTAYCWNGGNKLLSRYFTTGGNSKIYEEAMSWGSNATDYPMACNQATYYSINGGGSAQISFFADDLVGNTNAGNSTSFFINYVTESLANTSIVNEGNPSTFYLNLSASLITSLTGWLNYNGVNYAPSITLTPTTAQLSRQVFAPDVPADTNITWFWNYTINGQNRVNESIAGNQTILNVSLDDCSTGTLVIINYTIYDEKTKAIVSETGGSIEYDITLTSHSNSSAKFLLHNTKTDVNTTSICLPAGVLDYVDYRLDATAKFSSTGKVVEYKYFDNANVSQYNIPKETALYDLQTNQSTSFLITYQDDFYIYVKDAIIDVWRYYVGDGQFLSVENAKTDAGGQTSVHLVTEDIIYKFLVWKDGLLQYESPEYKALCQATPCQINLHKEIAGNGTGSVFDNIIYSYAFNQTQHIATFTYAINDGTSSTLNMTIIQGDTIVCSTQAVSSGGTLTCTIPTGFTNSTSDIFVYKDGKLLGLTSWNFNPNAFDLFGYTGIILTALTFLMLSLMMISSGIATIVFGIASLVFMGMMQIFATGNVGLSLAIIWLCIAGGIIIWKINKRRIS